jgi:molecular chaperone DnaK
MAHIKPIGIDLGTTFSAVSWVDEAGRTQMLRNAEGENLTPSIVLFSDAEVVVGRDARNATIANPELVAEWVKRDMGSPYYSRPIHGQYLPPEVIQACILRKLKADISRLLTPEPHVVITVPAYFDEPRRKATADAGEMAGLKVLDIVNEPTAAALAFGETMGYLTPSGANKADMTVLIYDLGGGTFDVTLLRLSPGNIRTLATDGDVQLGGHDWDLRVLDHLAESFEKAHQLDPRKDPRTVNRMLNAVIDAKHTLSARAKAMVRVEYQGKSIEVSLTRELFAELTASLLERTAYTTRQLVADARLDWKQVDRVLLVGGSTRMPMVVDMLRQMTGIEPDRTVNPDEAVARGAALYAAYLLSKQGHAAAAVGFEVSNVNSHSLGIEGIEPETLRKINVILIPRNTPLPAKHTERFVTKTESQRSIVIQVLEGESSLPGDCTAIGRTAIRDLPAGMPKGWPIEVAFEYGANGRLGVRAAVPGTQHAAALDLERASGMSNAGVSRWKNPVGAAAGFADFERLVQETLTAPDGGLPGIPLPTSPAAKTFAPGGSPQPTFHPPAPSAAQTPSPPPAGMQPGALPLPGSVPPGEPVQRPARDDLPKLSQPFRVPPWAVAMIGYVTSAGVGLGLGYLVLHLLRPDAFPIPW